MDVSGARTIPTCYDTHIIVSIFYEVTEHESGKQITSTSHESDAVSEASGRTLFTVLLY